MPGSGSDDAAEAQEAAARAQIDFAREVYGEQKELLAPFIQAGLPGLEGLSKLSTPEGQAEFLTTYYDSPQFATQSAQARNQQLAAAEATGGLQGTTTQNQLARISPTLGMQALEQQRGAYGTLANFGLTGAQATAGAAGTQVPVVSQAYGAIGQAQANQAMANQAMQSQLGSLIGGGIGMWATGGSPWGAQLGAGAGGAIGGLF